VGAGGLCGIACTLGALVLDGFSWSVSAGAEPHGVLLGELGGLVERRCEPVKQRSELLAQRRDSAGDRG